jgi:hypothetical protein
MAFRSTWSATFNHLVRAGAQGIACADISLAIWFKWDNTSADYEAIEINGSAGGTFAACIQIAGGDVTFHITNADGSSRISVVGPAYSAGVWTHAVLTYDSTTLRSYVNGVAGGTATGLTGTRGNWTDLQIGPGLGELQDAFFYTRAITADEVAALYRGRTPKNPTGLRHWLPLHLGANRLVDYSGNALNFTNSGTPADATTVPPVGWGAGETRLILPNATSTAITASGLTQTTGAAAVTAAASLAASGLTRTTGAAAVTGAAPLAAAGLTQTTGSAAVSSAAPLAAAGLTQTTGAAAVSTSSSLQLVASGLTQTTGNAALTAGAALAAAGLTQTTGAASVSQPGNLASSGLTQTTGQATLVATASLVAAGLTRTTGSADVSGNQFFPPIDVPVNLRPNLRRRIIWTNPLPPRTEYVSVLGTKLKFLFRAPSGVYGNSVRADAWTDSITGTRIPRTVGTPTLSAVPGMFSNKEVVQLAGSRFDGTFANPLCLNGDSPEMFAVFKANALATNLSTIVALVTDTTSSFVFELAAGVNQLQMTINVGTTGIAFTDTTAVHFFSARRDPATGNRVFHIDGVDTVGTAGALLGFGALRRVLIGFSPSLDGSVALLGLVQSPMSTEERAEVLRIARAEFGF